MATKLKNIKAIKIAALVMAVVMFLVSGFFGSLFIRSFAHYAGDTSATYFETPSFRYQMNRFITDMFHSAHFLTVNSIEDFQKTADGKDINQRYQKEAERVSQAFDLLEQSELKVHHDAQNRYRYSLVYNNVTYYFNYDGNFISKEEFSDLYYVDHYEEVYADEESTTIVEVPVNIVDNNIVYTQVHAAENPGHVYDPYITGNAPDYVNDISKALSTLYLVDGNYCYGEVTKDDFISIVDQNRENELANFFHQNNINKRSISNVKNVNYAMIYKSGAVVSNCGITATDTEEQILEKLVGDGRFAEGLKDGKYTLYKGNAPKERKSVFGLLRSWMFSDYYVKSQLETKSFLQGYYEDVQAAYFGIPVYKDVDGFSISEKAYSDFASAHIKSPTLFLTLTVITFLLACAAAVYLIAVAGKTANGVKINFTDKVPAEINWILGVGAMAILAFLALCLVIGEFDPVGLADDYFGSDAAFLTGAFNSLALFTSELIAFCFAGFFMIWTALNMSIARNIRNKTFIKHTLCYLIIRLAWKLIKFVCKPFGKLFRFLWKKSKKTVEKIQYIFTCDYSKGQGTKFKIIACASAILFVVLSIIYYFITGMLMSDGEEGLAFLLLLLGIIGDIAILLFVLLIIVSADRIFEAVNDVKNGNLNRTIDTKYMPPFMRRFAEDILSMQDGLQNAVESAVRDQRMKAELITNVSHDLKTPLTSIVTYVDLLKKCNIEGEDANRYVDILDEKAQKMKKLIEDLVEASKASSGAMEIHPVKINLCEFAAQAVGEHEDELKNKNIGILLRMPDYPVLAMADSQKTSRIVENLFSNIRKYAMEGTRAYVEVVEGERECSIVFKNISAEALDISADELTQRFVRGDASRSSEGNGLGLSIAKNLCELQKGRLEISIDGDLFKATVTLPKA
ncbi:MAG: HAMP domain-containing histidine kinase [Clostridia bacterium]|nr:HAMP domain-containing histidine kinase [Clostridia bacterium]